jgi:Concanavalin A-like lectin/glucanases superfamily
VHRLSLLFLVACAYHSPSSSMGGDDDDGLPPDGDTPVERACLSMADPALCIEFEQGIPDFSAMDIAIDGSANRFDADADNVIAMTRDMTPQIEDRKAAGFGLTSQLVIDQDLALDGDVTVEMWMQLGFGIGSRSWLFDSNHRFFLSYGNNNRQIRCGINSDISGLRIDSVTTIDDDAWHHVACTFERATSEMKIFIDGAVAGCKPLATTIAARPGGTTIGAPHGGGDSFDHFVGALDGIHVYKRVLEPAMVCISATGDTDCTAECPIAPIGPNSGGHGPGQ